jgi:hypothetical protein
LGQNPVNSSTLLVLDFKNHFSNNQEMLDGQFNPFIKESTPPVVINIKIKKVKVYEQVCALLCWDELKRVYSEISVEAIDVAQFTVVVKINDNSGRSATFHGEGHEWFVAELDLNIADEWIRYKVTIEMLDFAGNELDPPYEEEVVGWFGGLLRMLEAS